ncbi:Carbon monoxide dehydrogenase subunit G [Micromonospora coriariae]|uniref:Carbon monoxide dehydrogenase subunit G n=1 Tax=Micromonospora coriariae TaxID=285665 RepID=A0A1C4XHA7_9ACTN|nr:SRPBCC family protein [Micromonospora coriariae]SCF07908.1 Carbon monoxide dehydrogenase subunit G [Micromonospora coriariae]
MKITNEFAVAVPIERAWAVLTDLEGIAPCLPGAQLTGVDGDVYRGRVRVKVGPVISEFAGTARFVEKDDAAYHGVIDAKGRDARSTGNASALVTAHLRPDGDRTLVSVDTDLKISGKLAQFGSGMIKEVSGRLLTQFVSNLEAKLAAEQAPTAADGPATVPAPRRASDPVTPASQPEPGPLSAASAPAVASTPVTAAVEPSPVEPSPVEPSPVDPSAAAPPATSAAEPEALDLLSIAGGSITKRLVPVIVGLVAAGVVIAWLIARR